MRKCIAYEIGIAEAEEMLQWRLDNSGLKLVRKPGGFFYAESDTQELDGAEIDELMSDILRCGECAHYATYENSMIVITK